MQVNLYVNGVFVGVRTAGPLVEAMVNAVTGEGSGEEMSKAVQSFESDMKKALEPEEAR